MQVFGFGFGFTDVVRALGFSGSAHPKNSCAKLQAAIASSLAGQESSTNTTCNPLPLLKTPEKIEETAARTHILLYMSER